MYQLYQLKSLIGQDIEVAKTLKPGRIVNLKFNPSKGKTEVFYKEAYLGTLNKDVKVHYARILTHEPLVSKMNFTFQLIYSANMNDVKAREIEDEYFNVKKQNRYKLSDEEIMEGDFFKKIALNLRYYDMNLEKIINSYLIQNKGNDELIRLEVLNEKDELIDLLKKYWQENPNVNQPSVKLNYSNYVRQTVCWSCGSNLNSIVNGKCTRCNWIKCSCGACSKRCSSI